MSTKEILAEIVQIHNRASEIAVHGDDVIRMAEVLTRCRSLVKHISEQDEPVSAE